MAKGRHQNGVGLPELVITLALVMILGGVSLAKLSTLKRNYRVNGDQRQIAAELLLAKMRAASGFTQSRVYFDTSAGSLRIELWDKTTSTWVSDNPNATIYLSEGVTYPSSFGTLTTAPTGGTLAQPASCVPGTTSTPGGGTAISGTYCVIFNSRGIPIDTSSAPVNYGVYISDGTGYYGTTIGAAGLLQLWRTPKSAASWAQR